MEICKEINTAVYLSRIGIGYVVVADEKSLRLLQRQHLLNVPFENLDIHWKRPIVLDTHRFYQKIVIDKHGGFCYELNGLFNGLLRSLGFQTRLISARVGDGKSNFSPENDHAAIIVTIGKMEYLVDVGFGAFTAEPLQFTPDIKQHDETGVFVIRRFEDGYFKVAKKEGEAWRSEYIFKPLGRDLSEFETRCDFHQYSPDSHFTKNKLCSLMTEKGRKTLTDKSFIVTIDDEKSETPVNSADEFDLILSREFDIRRPK